jgi:hypothetical protein
LLFGRLFDRFGFTVLVILTLISILFAPLVFLGGFWAALIGAAIIGSAAIGILYDVSLPAVIVFC